MLPAFTAAGREILTAVSKQRRPDQRKAEQEQQHGGKQTAHYPQSSAPFATLNKFPCRVNPDFPSPAVPG